MVTRNPQNRGKRIKRGDTRRSIPTQHGKIKPRDEILKFTYKPRYEAIGKKDKPYQVNVFNFSNVKVDDKVMQQMPRETITYAELSPLDLVKERFRVFFKFGR